MTTFLGLTDKLNSSINVHYSSKFFFFLIDACGRLIFTKLNFVLSVTSLRKLVRIDLTSPRKVIESKNNARGY